MYLCAILPDTPDFFATFQATPALTSGVRPAPDGSVMELDPAVVRDAFYHDCSDADAARAAERLCPQPARAFAMRFELAPDRCAIDIAAQRAMHAKMPATVHALDASHSPFFSMPDPLALVLDRIAQAR